MKPSTLRTIARVVQKDADTVCKQAAEDHDYATYSAAMALLRAAAALYEAALYTERTSK